jgi:hypothetical protein
MRCNGCRDRSLKGAFDARRRSIRLSVARSFSEVNVPNGIEVTKVLGLELHALLQVPCLVYSH